MFKEYWHCYLIKINGFKVISEKCFNIEDLPFSKGKTIPFTYHWITSHFFEDHIIKDCQYKNFSKRGFPDFKINPKNNPNKDIFVEFKGISDALSNHQIFWFASHPSENNFILLCEEITKEKGTEAVGSI